MRFISFHCEYFKYLTTKKSRSKILEELNEDNKKGTLENVIVLFISVDKKDENDKTILSKTIIEIEKITKQLKVSNIFILSFAHLFGELSAPEFGFETLKNLESLLEKEGYIVLRAPFGWFNEFELKSKGHPLSRISRTI